MSQQILRCREVCNRTGLGRSALYAAIQEGRFPRQIKLGPRAAGWLSSEVEDWIAGRVRDRDAEKAGG